jgi:predicted SnoaL-like aldol condensation-catalyzing enzyme
MTDRLQLFRSNFLATAAAVTGGALMPSRARAQAHLQSQGNVSMNDYIPRVVELLKSFESGDSRPLSFIDPAKYIQHNLPLGDGMKALADRVQAIPKGSAKVNTLRAFRDGNYVFTHSEYDFGEPMVGFDIFRFENGLIVEHWDNLQKAGLTGLLAGLQALAKQGLTVEYDGVHMILGQGDFVLVVNEGKFGGKPTAIYDLYRVADGKIAEHWDTLEAIPPHDAWKNDNGKF